MKRIALSLLLVGMLAGCSASGDDMDTISTLVAATQTAAAGGLSAPLPTPDSSLATPPAPTFTPTPAVELGAVYSDPQLGYAFDYPSAWKVAYQEAQARGGYFQFTRSDFQPDPGAGGLPEEEILLQVALYNWDPRGDLDAYLDQRYLAWDSSGIAVSEISRWTRPGGEPAVELLITGSEGDQALLILTLVGDQYLELSTGSEFEALSAIGATLRGAE